MHTEKRHVTEFLLAAVKVRRMLWLVIHFAVACLRHTGSWTRRDHVLILMSRDAGRGKRKRSSLKFWIHPLSNDVTDCHAFHARECKHVIGSRSLLLHEQDDNLLARSHDLCEAVLCTSWQNLMRSLHLLAAFHLISWL